MYKDIPFNLKIATNTDIKLLEEEKAVQQSVKNILLTKKGELHYFPQFGCGIRKYLFEKLNTFTYLGIRDEIRFALENFEPRITLMSIEIKPSEDENRLEIDLVYNINSINVMSNQQLFLGIQ